MSWAVAVALFMVWTILFPPPVATFWYLFQGMLAVWLILLMSLLAGANPKVVISVPGLEVTNWLFQYSVPWQAIHWIQQTDVIVIHLHGGKKIKPAVGGWSLPGRIRGNPQQRKIQEQIEQARSAAEDQQSGGTVIRRKLHIHPVPAVVVFAALVLFAYVMRG